MIARIKTKTQPQRLADIIKTHIAPTMKSLGFKRKNKWFGKEGKDYTTSMHITSGKWNTKQEVSFALSLYVFQKHISGSSKPVAYERVGRLKTGQDTWYELTPEINAEQLGQQVKQDILTYAVPFFSDLDKKDFTPYQTFLRHISF